ncbi:MAG: hypothetical protein HN712_10115 [Gemmatimonadetes bacterium]|nr:hypothetical protein [Gemmatimonadota bacterium]MBT7860657.1 hypothetical protein [Gemmatimonadota bacterium]
MTIGRSLPAEIVERTDAGGRRLRQLTSAPAHSYPLYYFTPSTTADGRWLVFHSERSGSVQLYRMDLESGAITQLSNQERFDAGWAIWCEYRLRGIDNHLSALNPVRSEAYYFVGDTLYCTDVEELTNRQVLQLRGRVAISQNAFSPDGRWFAFVHTDALSFREGLQERESKTNMGQFSWGRDHNTWRNGIDCVISVVDTTTGMRQDLLDLDYHVHHVLFADDDTLLLNHVKGDSGMWTLSMDGTKIRHLRPRDENGVTCHQAVTARGIYYEANTYVDGERIVQIGRLDAATGAYEEVRLPNVGYVHTGLDPEGRFMFYEDMQEDRHRLLTVRYPRDPARFEVEELRSLGPIAHGQRYHAHPFLAAHDRRWLYHTEVIDGFAQICALDVADLVDENVYWDAE